MIRVCDLSFSYKEHQVLKGVSFEIQPGTVNFLLGANGAGKTTLFRCMLGVLSGYGGRILLEGKNIRDFSAIEMAERMAYIPQAHSSIFAYTVIDVVLMGLNRRLSLFSVPGKKEREIGMQALEQLGIAHLASRNYQQLSGGEQQLALIARALAQQARILMMDEPTSSLDFGNQIRVHEQVCRLAQCGYTIMLSSHNPQHALSFADRVLTIQDGQLAADGRPEEVLSEAMMQALYGIEVKTIDSPYGRVVIPFDRERENRRTSR